MGQVTIKGATVDIFGTFAGVKAHFEQQLGSGVWEDGDTGDKNKALVYATRWLTRIGVIDASGDELLPSLADTNVPEDVKLGTYELAQDLLADATLPDGTPGSDNKRRVKAGSAEVEFFRQQSGTKLPKVVLEYLGEFLASNQSGSTGGLASGTDECSEFGDTDKYGLGRGYS